MAAPEHHANPVLARLLLAMHADMGETVGPRPVLDAILGDTGKGTTQPRLDLADEFLETPDVEHIFEPRLVAIGAIAVVDEDTDDGVCDLGRLFRLQVDAGRPRKIP